LFSTNLQLRIASPVASFLENSLSLLCNQWRLLSWFALMPTAEYQFMASSVLALITHSLGSVWSLFRSCSVWICALNSSIMQISKIAWIWGFQLSVAISAILTGRVISFEIWGSITGMWSIFDLVPQLGWRDNFRFVRISGGTKC